MKLKLNDPNFGSYHPGQKEVIDSIIMTTTLEYIIDAIGLPPAPASLTWDNDEGFVYPIIHVPSDVKEDSKAMKAIRAYIVKSSDLDKYDMEAEIYDAYQEFMEQKASSYETKEAIKEVNQILTT